MEKGTGEEWEGEKKEEVNFSLCNNIHCISNHPEEDLEFILFAILNSEKRAMDKTHKYSVLMDLR